MNKVVIYHNPRCSKSRQTLALLQDRNIQPEVVEYLKTPLDKATIVDLLKKLGLEPQQLVRQKELRALNMPFTDDPQELIARMAQHPEIIERPIVVNGVRACLGRPPENVVGIL